MDGDEHEQRERQSPSRADGGWDKRHWLRLRACAVALGATWSSERGQALSPVPPHLGASESPSRPLAPDQSSAHLCRRFGTHSGNVIGQSFTLPLTALAEDGDVCAPRSLEKLRMVTQALSAPFPKRVESAWIRRSARYPGA
ncbi:hypothetical protein CDD83_9398 [Cordyceps sp. RAO-2017]|nr:hypothetical protein CDD83_9398 [Cordyceps sp. RAO-2017]